MKKEEQASLVHDLGFRKRQRHTHKTGQTLPQGVIPTLDVGGFSGLFAYRIVLRLRDDRSIDSQKVGEALALTKFLGNGFPQPLARLFAAIPNGIAL